MENKNEKNQCEHQEKVRCNKESCDGIGFYHEQHCAKCGDEISWFDSSIREDLIIDGALTQKMDVIHLNKDWHEEERRAWINIDSDFPDFIRYADSIADYWLSRMESRIQEARDKALASASTQIPYLRAEGRTSVIEEMIDKVKGMEINNTLATYYREAEEVAQDYGYNKAINEILTALQTLRDEK